MRRLMFVGIFFEAALLIVGLTWIAPMTRNDRATTETTSQTTAAQYKLTGQGSGTVVDVNLTATETVQELAPGVRYHVWTFDGTAPAPVIRVQLGDTIHFTLTNSSTIGMQHSIDFHAAMTPWADLPASGQTTLTGNYQPVSPGQTKSFDWVAMYPGVFMYHCGVPPVLQHISNGMYGAIVVEPPGLPKEREYVLVSSEFYPGPKPIHGVYEGDLDRMLAVDPQYVVFNGVADQYKTLPLVVRPNERFRLWVVNAGPTLTNAFHVIGTMFDKTYPTGNPANVLYGLQTYSIAPGDGAMFELQIPDAGLYPFVTHAFAYTGLGAVGLIKVDPSAPPAPSSYPTMGEPFSAGVTPFNEVPPKGGSSSPGTTTGGSSSAGATSCSPKGTELSITAQNTAFNTDCLAAPAGKRFSISLDNIDPGVPHNISIYTDTSTPKALFTGGLVTGPKVVTYHIGPFDAGTYVFRCDVHPTTMTGTFLVK